MNFKFSDDELKMISYSLELAQREFLDAAKAVKRRWVHQSPTSSRLMCTYAEQAAAIQERIEQR